MKLIYLIHILAGGLGLAAGYLALFSAKGAPLHRRSGMLFAYAMLAMCAGGTLIALVRGVAPAINVPASLLTSYLVITSLLTLRPPAARSRRVDLVLMLLALAVGLVMLTFAFEALASPDGTKHGMPPFPFFMFGVVGTLASALDVRMIRAGGLQGSSRLARHLWRMSFALFIAAMSFFLGQADVFPEALRIPPLLALPVLAVLVTMFYWLWRVRARRSARGLVVAGAPEAAR